MDIKQDKPIISKLAVLAAFFTLLSACSGGDNSYRDSAERDTGSIQFNLSWDDTSLQRKAGKSSSGDVCVDYAIDTVVVSVQDNSNTIVASESWPCSYHSGTIDTVPEGSDMTLTIAGIVAGSSVWQGQVTGISLAGGEDEQVGKVTMKYTGNDATPPFIVVHSPTSDAANVPLNSVMAVIFSEDVVSASVKSAIAVVGTQTVAGNVAYDASTMTASFMPDFDLDAETSYSIIITAEIEDLAGNQMAGLYTWSFTTGRQADMAAPAIPSLLDVTAVSNSQIDLSWKAPSDNAGVAYYKIYRNDSHVKSVSTTWTTDTNLSPETSYCYVVTAIDGAENESYLSNEICEMTHSVPPPSIPTLMSPQNRDELDNNCHDFSDAVEWTFEWSDVTAATKYHIYIIAPNASNPAVDTQIASSFYDHHSNGYIADHNRYGWRWKVRAGNDDGQWSAWSEERHFDVELLNTDCPGGSPPATPELISPQDGDKLDNNCQDRSDAIVWNFQWSDVTAATKYHIYVVGPNASNPVIDTEIASSFYNYTNSGGYIIDSKIIGWAWKVRAGNDDGQWSTWSQERIFDVEPLNTDCP
jgi:chitodextrinase